MTRNINAKEFKDAIKNAGVKMVAITNHNTFYKQQFDEFYDEIHNDFILLPGIELDTIGINKEKGHVVIIYDDKDVYNFQTKINEILGDSSPDNFSITINLLIDLINNIDCIVLAHYFKPDALDLESIDYIKNNIKNSFRLFFEPGSYRTLGIMLNHNYRAIKGSDIVDWSKYGMQEFADIKLDIDSYKQLLMFLKKDETVIETLLNKQIKYNIDIAYKKNEHEFVELYDNVNVFFGTKGTGKSVSLDKIKNFFLQNGKKTSEYSSKDTKDKLDAKIEILENEKKLESYGRENLSDEFASINKWVESDVTQFSDYYNYVKYRTQNSNKQKMKIVEIRNVLINNTNELQKTKHDFNSIKTIINLLNGIDIEKYISKEKNKSLIAIFENLLEAIKFSYSAEFDNKVSIKCTNTSISKIKAIVEKKTETKTIPSESGFLKFAKKHFNLEIVLNKIFDAFNFKYESEPEYIGKLEEGKLLYKITTASMLNDYSKSVDGFTSIKNLKEIKENLVIIKNNIYTNELYTYINQFKDKYSNNLSLNNFLGVTKKFIVDGHEYIPSTGEATMIILNDALDQNYDVYILDEPEKSLGNNYVNDFLVSRLNDLAKMKKVVIVATHNANIAVRTMPYRSILKVYDNGEYKTYVGNPYVNKLTNISDKNDFRNWKEESIKILEGGKEAFEERKDIYEQ